MPQVHIPPPLRRLTRGRQQLDVEGETVRQLIAALDGEFPGFRDRICAAGRLKPGIAVAIGSRISDLGLLQPVAPENEVHFVVSVAGG